MIDINRSTQSSGIQVGLLQEDEPLELISLLDVILLLLIFFILTSGANYSFTEINLPHAQKTETQDSSSLQVLIEIPLQPETWNINGVETHDKKELNRLILEHYQNTPNAVFVLAPERSLPVERFLWLLNFLSNQKIKNIQVMNEGQIE